MSLQTAIAGLQSAISTQVTALQTVNVSLQTNIAGLQSAISTQATALQTVNVSLQTNIAGLQSAISTQAIAFQTMNVSLQTAIVGLQSATNLTSILTANITDLQLLLANSITRIGSTEVQLSVLAQCLSSPCQHGGSCTIINNTHSCACTDGFSGRNCEVVVPCPANCKPSTCGGDIGVFSNTSWLNVSGTWGGLF